MKKKFITNLILLLTLNILVKPFYIFGIDRTVQVVVGAEAYGFYFALFNLSLIFNIVLDSGINNFNNRSIAQNNNLLSKYFSNIIGIKFVLAIFYLIIIIFVTILLNYSIEQFRMLLLLALNQFIAMFILYFRSNISGLHFFKTDSILSVLDRVLLIIICSFLLWGNITEQEMRIEWFVYAQTISYSFTMFIAFVLVLIKCEYFKPKINLKYFIIILKQSYPYALLHLLMGLYYRVDSVMLELMLRPDGTVHAGIYAQAFRILDALSMFGFLFAGLLLPIFASMIKLKQGIGPMLKFSFLLIIVPSLILSLGSVLYRSDIINLLYPEHIEYSSTIFGLLILGFPAISTTYIFGTLLTANGNLKYLNIMAGSATLLNILLNTALIPVYQATGSAAASLATQILTAIAQVIIVKKVFGFTFNYSLIIRLAIFVVLLIVTGILSKGISGLWILNLLIMAIIATVAAIILKLLNAKNILHIIRYGENE